MKNNKISVCICSRDYNKNLIKLLEAIKKEYNPSRYHIHISIIFNFLKKIELIKLKAIKKTLSPISYKILYEKKIGVSYARNKYLDYIKNKKVDYCCFIDDDCLIQKKFFSNHLKFIKKENCKIVTGPQIYKSKLIFFRLLERQFIDRKIVKWAATNNVFFKKSILKKNLFFSEKVTKYGFGEDQLFFSKLSKSGEQIKWLNNKVYEVVQKDRQNIYWFLKRNYFFGLTGYLIDKELYGNYYGILINIAKSIIYLLKMIGNFPLIIFHPKKFLLLSLSNIIRSAGRIIGLKNIF